VGISDRVRRWIDPPRPPEPDEMVVVTHVPFHEGPMVQSALEGAGITAFLQEWTVLPGHLPSRQRILVRHGDLAAAEDVLRDLSGR
jgi:hypothetical protein